MRHGVGSLGREELLWVGEFCGKGVSVGRGVVSAGQGLLGSRDSQRSPSLPSPQTTIMAVEFDGGVVIGADSRTTTG